MAPPSEQSPPPPPRSPVVRALTAPLEFLGRRTLAMLDQVGASLFLMVTTISWSWRAAWDKRVRLGRPAIITQMVRIGVRSVFIVSLVSGCVGLILAFQLSPPLDQFGQKELVANIIAIAVLRELGPLIGAIVLTGFAGASIAAEIGTMVVSEEVEALEAHALDPVRFLVVPRVFASVFSMTVLAVLADVVAVIAALGIAVTALEIPYTTFVNNMLDQAKLVDFLTGVSKGTVFGLLIGLIACVNGLRVTGGAAGVGRATTGTVVQCIVAIVIADLAFTAVFYAFRLF
ncbi:Intermembrane phospholipid transport system permease protein MlaE [Phycisphaerales bacterium]|nr:Intermembrane phospholipid transport system permease protein MlaE [Phycisphaerales bacterium]